VKCGGQEVYGMMGRNKRTLRGFTYQNGRKFQCNCQSKPLDTKRQQTPFNTRQPTWQVRSQQWSTKTKHTSEFRSSLRVRRSRGQQNLAINFFIHQHQQLSQISPSSSDARSLTCQLPAYSTSTHDIFHDISPSCLLSVLARFKHTLPSNIPPSPSLKTGNENAMHAAMHRTIAQIKKRKFRKRRVSRFRTSSQTRSRCKVCKLCEPKQTWETNTPKRDLVVEDMYSGLVEGVWVDAFV
jgi:hypothetical protein